LKHRKSSFVSPAPGAPDQTDPDQRRRADEGDTAMALGRGGDSIHVFSGITIRLVLEIGPLFQSESVSRAIIGAYRRYLSLIGFVYLLRCGRWSSV
jgi:two-component system sensor histidine kinase RstB